MEMVPVAVATLILALLARTTVAAAEGQTICDTAKCGRGTCSEVPALLPVTNSYKCTCDPGWSQPKAINFTFPFAPCIIPDCPFDSSCFNLSLAPPKGIPLTDPCVAINCGPGECKKGDDLFSYSCECEQGYVNFLNLTAFPCVKNCAFGTSCSKLGIPPPPPPPSTAPPPGNHDSSAPPTGPKGSVPSSGRLLQLMLILSLAMVLLL
ncbi:unnamed protein product [Urochloa humidicola]